LEILLYCVLSLQVLLLFASLISIVRSKSSTRSQKVMQALLATFVPIIGPTICLTIFWIDRSPKDIPSGRYIGQNIDESRVPFTE
jgi:hypothetical protein